MSTTPADRVCRKARTIFIKAFGKRGSHLFTASSTSTMMQTMTTAFARRMRRERAESVGFHMGDWAGDAAIILALHMFPEKFTRKEIRDVTENLAAHLPYHCAALGAHFGYEGLARSGIRDVNQPKRLTNRHRRSAPRRTPGGVKSDCLD